MQDKSLDNAGAVETEHACPDAAESEYEDMDEDNNELGPMGCKILASSNILSRLTELHLNNNKIKDTGVKELSKVGLDFIEDLSLSYKFPIKMRTRSPLMASRNSPERFPTSSASAWEETNSTTLLWPPSTHSTLTTFTSSNYVAMLLPSSKPVFRGWHEEGAGRQQKSRRAVDRAKQGEGLQGQVQAQGFVFVLLT